MVDLTGFNEIYPPWVMAVTALCVCATCGILTKQNKKKWFYPGVLSILLLMTVLCRGMLLDGFCSFWNQLGDMWTAARGYVIPKLGMMNAQEHESMSMFVFSLFSGSVVAVICCGLAQLEKQIFTVLLPMLLFGGLVAFPQEKPWLYIITYLLFAIGLFLCGKGKHDDSSAKLTASRWLPVVLCSMTLLMLASLPLIETWTLGVGQDVQDKIHEARYETAYTTLPEGDFTDFSASDTQNHPALVVNMENPEAMYLRGFTGAVFENNSWQPLDGRILVENEELLYWMHQQNWNTHGLFAKAVSLTTEEDADKMQEITIQNLNACSKYVYVPYTLCADTFLEPEQISPDGAISQGKDIYVFTTISGGAEQIRQTLNKLNGDIDEVKEYIQAENNYREFVSNYYLEIPQDIEEKLLPHWKKIAKEYGPVEKLSSEEKQECVRAFLTACFPEDGEKVKIELPLDQVKGSSYQYATVAAMTLRHFGIPSRYAEGYVITKEMAENADDGTTIQVGSNNGGAWVELYQNGLGWIPMAVMPGIETEPMGVNLDAEDGDMPKEIPPKESLQDNQPNPEEKPTSGGAAALIKENPVISLLFCFGILFAVLLIIAVRRKVILKKRSKRWDETAAKDAAPWIFADAADLLRRLGLMRGNGSMRELVTPIRERFGVSYAKDFEHMIIINDRALFSSRPLEEEYRETAKAFYTDTLHLLLADAKWYKKLWMQWILCLY